MYGYGYGYGHRPLPGWVPAGSSAFWDFTTGQYWVGAKVDEATATNYTRSGTAYQIDTSDDYQSFGANEIRRTDAGVIVEPAETYKITFPYALSNAAWTNGGVTSTAYAGTFANLFADAKTISGASSVNSGLQRDITSFWTSGTPVTFVVRFIVGTSGLFMVRFVNTGDFSASKISYNGTTAAGTASGAGGITNITVFDFADHKALLFTLTPNFTGTNRMLLGPDSTSGTVHLVGAEAVAGTLDLFSPFPAAGSRPADSLQLVLPSGTHDLTYTFDDDTTQAVAGQSGTYDVPTSLDRRTIKTVRAVAA